MFFYENVNELIKEFVLWENTIYEAGRVKKDKPCIHIVM